MSPLVEMVAICDIYDALISSRPYRVGEYDNRTALEELCDIADAGALGRYNVQARIGRNRAGYPAPEEVRLSTERRGHLTGLQSHGTGPGLRESAARFCLP